MGWAAALAMTAALFHVFNHSVFKSLLFFGSGAVLAATGERDMEHLGGLIHRMPQTAFVFLVGCVAISALPPLNGFVSEWLTFQAILISPSLPQWGLKFAVPAVGALLALSAALAATCFVKAFGVCFLGRPRTLAAERANETDAGRSRPCSSSPRCACSPAHCRRFFLDTLAPAVKVAAGERMPVADGARLADDRAHRREPQLLQRPAGVPLHRRLGGAHRLRHPSRGNARLAPRAGLGLRLSQCEPSDANTPPRASRSRSAASSATFAFFAREKVTMPLPGDPRPARLEVTMRDPVWDVFYAPITARRRAHGRPAQLFAVPDHPQLSQLRVRSASWPSSWWWRYGHDPRLRRPGRADAAGACAGAAASGLHAQGQGAPRRAQGSAHRSALPRSRFGSCARKRCSPRTPRGCSASRPI